MGISKWEFLIWNLSLKIININNKSITRSICNNLDKYLKTLSIKEELKINKYIFPNIDSQINEKFKEGGLYSGEKKNLVHKIKNYIFIF